MLPYKKIIWSSGIHKTYLTFLAKSERYMFEIFSSFHTFSTSLFRLGSVLDPTSLQLASFWIPLIDFSFMICKQLSSLSPSGKLSHENMQVTRCSLEWNWGVFSVLLSMDSIWIFKKSFSFRPYFFNSDFNRVLRSLGSRNKKRKCQSSATLNWWAVILTFDYQSKKSEKVLC